MKYGWISKCGGFFARILSKQDWCWFGISLISATIMSQRAKIHRTQLYFTSVTHYLFTIPGGVRHPIPPISSSDEPRILTASSNCCGKKMLRENKFGVALPDSLSQTYIHALKIILMLDFLILWDSICYTCCVHVVFFPSISFSSNFPRFIFFQCAFKPQELRLRSDRGSYQFLCVISSQLNFILEFFGHFSILSTFFNLFMLFTNFSHRECLRLSKLPFLRAASSFPRGMSLHCNVSLVEWMRNIFFFICISTLFRRYLHFCSHQPLTNSSWSFPASFSFQVISRHFSFFFCSFHNFSQPQRTEASLEAASSWEG